MEELDEVILSKERKFDGVVIDVEHWKVRLPDGSEGLREIVLHKGAAAVIPVDEQGRVAMVRQYRTPLERETLEIPAGKLEKGEDPFEAGKREFKEECGATADSYFSLGEVYPSPGYCGEIIHLYGAAGLHFGQQHLDEGEYLDVVRMPLDEAVRRVMTGEIKDAKTAIAILKLKERINP